MRAAQLTTVDKVVKCSAQRSAVFKTSLKETDLPQIQAPLAEKTVSRTHDIQLEAGTSGDNLQNKTVHLVVVKNESILAKDRSFALYATSAHLKLKSKWLNEFRRVGTMDTSNGDFRRWSGQSNTKS